MELFCAKHPDGRLLIDTLSEREHSAHLKCLNRLTWNDPTFTLRQMEMAGYNVVRVELREAP